MRYRSSILTLSVLGILTGLAQAQLITSVERRNSGNPSIAIAANPLAEESRCFVGSANHTYRFVPEELLGLEYVQTANEDRENADYEMDVTFSHAATLYLLLDNRLGKGGLIVREQKPDLIAAGMDWVIDMGFVDTGVGVGSDQYTNGVLDGWFSIYALPVPPGKTTLYAQNDGIRRIMYTVAAAPRSMDLAENPMPIDGETDVLQETPLSWIAGINAATHDVYLDQDFNEVNDASRNLPGTVLIARDHSDTAIDPGALEFGNTYFWRVDEVNAPSKPGIFKGNIWSFTVEPFVYTVIPAVVEASSSYSVMVPENTVNGSGINDNDQHGTILEDMWLTENGDTDPWIQYEFENPEKLLEMRIWNTNQFLEFIFGFGVQKATIEISMNGSNWTTLPETPIFAPGTGIEEYEYNTVIDFGGQVAKYVRINVISTYGGTQASLAEVRFISLPAYARYLVPANGTVLDGLVAELSWRSGRQAVSSQIVFSTELAAVEDGSAVLDTTEAAHYEVTGLDYAQVYYWRIVDLNDTAVPPVAAGPIMRLLTPEEGAIDDMEFYAAEAFKEIWDFWVDGFNDNTNGATVGIDKDGNPGGSYPSKDKYEGAQSLPMAYDNTIAAISEATRTFAPALDLGAGNPESVGIYFKGFPDNDAASVYLTFTDSSNRSATIAHPDPAATRLTDWTLLRNRIADLNINTSSIESITVGVDRSGAQGELLVDFVHVHADR